GQGMTIQTVHMDFLYGGAFRTGLPEAYERLILDTMLGDATLFTRNDEIDEQWLLVDALVAQGLRGRTRVPNQPARPWGPPRPRARGARRAPRSCSAGTGVRGDGTDHLVRRGRPPRRRRPGDLAAAGCDRDRGRHAESPNERDDAHGLGPRALDRPCAGGAVR